MTRKRNSHEPSTKAAAHRVAGLPEARHVPGTSEAVDGQAPDGDAVWIELVRHRLIAWYEGEHRKLPWRATSDPYRILVSEMMLVQTTVTAVIPFYGRFIDRFPDVRALAEAEEADVLK